MSCRNDDSFGPSENCELDSNNLSFENHEIEKLKNNEIKTKNFLTRKYVIALIKSSISQIIQVFKNKSFEKKIFSFNKLKIFSEFRKLNKIKAHIIYRKLVMSLNTFKKIYNKKEFLLKLKYTFLWRNNSLLHTQLINVKNNLENNLKKSFENHVNEIDNKLKTKEQDLTMLKNKLEKQLETEEKLIKIISNFSANEKLILTELQKVEEERNTIQEEITYLQNKCTDNYNLCENLQSNLESSEKIITQLKEENKQKNYNISIFLREMNEMLQAHEKNIEIMNYETEENRISPIKTKLPTEAKDKFSSTVNTSINMPTNRNTYSLSNNTSSRPQIGTTSIKNGIKNSATYKSSLNSSKEK